jgi:DNA-damage-inducible protein D
MSTKISLFHGKKIRKTIHNNEWWFSVVDVIEALTGSDRPRKYWNDLKKKLADEGYIELSEKIGQLKLEAADGKIEGLKKIRNMRFSLLKFPRLLLA